MDPAKTTQVKLCTSYQIKSNQQYKILPQYFVWCPTWYSRENISACSDISKALLPWCCACGESVIIFFASFLEDYFFAGPWRDLGAGGQICAPSGFFNYVKVYLLTSYPTQMNCIDILEMIWQTVAYNFHIRACHLIAIDQALSISIKLGKDLYL